jgi:hypothetical protein
MLKKKSEEEREKLQHTDTHACQLMLKGLAELWVLTRVRHSADTSNLVISPFPLPTQVPKQGLAEPWVLTQNCLVDLCYSEPMDVVEDGVMEFVGRGLTNKL